MDRPLWDIVQEEYDSRQNRKYETLFTLANGYRGMRGVLEFSRNGECGNFLAGIFDKSDAQVTEIVNFQNPLALNIYIEDELVDLDRCDIMNYKRTLDMRKGILSCEFKVMTQKGRIVEIRSERYVSKSNVHRWASSYRIIPVNFSGKLFVENIIDGTITNSTCDPFYTVKHFRVEECYDLAPGIAQKSRTLDKGIGVIEASVLMCRGEKGNFFKGRKFGVFGEKAREVYEAYITEGTEYSIDKFGVTYTSRDSSKSLYDLCRQEMDKFICEGYEREKLLHIKRWEEIWDNIDIEIEGDEEAQLGIRFNLFHLAASAYDGDERVSIAAKALHGEGYKGHVFWDTETFMLPFFTYTMPHVARALLMYRYNTLKGARENARINGFKGAQFPWESADDGSEVTPKWGFDYDGHPIRIWTGDEEFHINSDIVFGIWEYYRATGDKDFLLNYGLEIFLDTSKFWQSRVEYNEELDRYEINTVIGPDEFHEHVNNNVYTNYLAKWSIRKTLELVEGLKAEDGLLLRKLFNKLCITDNDLKELHLIEEKIFIPRSRDGKLIEQFEGYFSLPDITVKEYDENGMPLWPELNGLRYQETQLIKQADVVMLMLMLSDEFDEETKKENYRYYEKRTMHKSSLSPSMYSIMGLNVGDTNNSYRYFIKTIMTDLRDNQGNTDLGLHAASTGGAWQSAIFGFGGVNVDKEGMLNIAPWIPEQWGRMSFKLNWRGSKIAISVRHNDVEIMSDKTAELKAYGRKYVLSENGAVSVKR